MLVSICFVLLVSNEFSKARNICRFWFEKVWAGNSNLFTKMLHFCICMAICKNAAKKLLNAGADKVGGGFVEVAPPTERSITGLEVMSLLKSSTNDLTFVLFLIIFLN